MNVMRCIAYSNCDVLLVCAHAKDHGEHRAFNCRILPSKRLYLDLRRNNISSKLYEPD